MQIQVHSADAQVGDPVINCVYEHVGAALDVFDEQITRVEVHLHDDDGPKSSGTGKRCVIEVRLAGHQPLGVEHQSNDIYESIRAAAGKAERAVRRRIERHREHKERNDM
ncbi:MAG: HPF/RaiA family ribosome-associated protein [Planctomycetota bacterium]|jgi:ribosome-associated translation inhibitor RaiA